MGRGIIYVMAKEPQAGRVKTRLSPPLSHEQCAALAAAFAADTLARLCAGAAWEVVLAVEPEDGGPILRGLCARFGVARLAQGDGDLGGRMQRIMEHGCEQGRPTVLVGSDTPDLPEAYVSMAFDSLQNERVVLGPSRDGGYYLVGARAPVPGLFDIDAAWGSDQVMAATQTSLKANGISPFVLPAWEDVDDGASLSRLRLRLREEVSHADHTVALLEELSRKGVGF